MKDLGALPGNRLEALKGNRRGQYSIRINDKQRICFEWPPGSPGPMNVEIVDCHEGLQHGAQPHPSRRSSRRRARRTRDVSRGALAPARLPVNRITAIINGQRGLTADTALRLGHWFGTSPDFWLNLQMMYELRVAQQEVGDLVKALPTRAGSRT